MSLLARPEVAVAAPLTGSLQVGLKINFLFSSEISRSHTAFFIYNEKILLRKKINISYFLFFKNNPPKF